MQKWCNACCARKSAKMQSCVSVWNPFFVRRWHFVYSTPPIRPMHRLCRVVFVCATVFVFYANLALKLLTLPLTLFLVRGSRWMSSSKPHFRFIFAKRAFYWFFKPNQTSIQRVYGTSYHIKPDAVVWIPFSSVRHLATNSPHILWQKAHVASNETKHATVCLESSFIHLKLKPNA